MIFTTQGTPPVQLEFEFRYVSAKLFTVPESSYNSTFLPTVFISFTSLVSWTRSFKIWTGHPYDFLQSGRVCPQAFKRQRLFALPVQDYHVPWCTLYTFSSIRQVVLHGKHPAKTELYTCTVQQIPGYIAAILPVTLRILDVVLFDPWIQDKFFPDSISKPYLESLVTHLFWVKNT